jgi:glycosyltransferase involved in cell wall biosynthesis
MVKRQPLVSVVCLCYNQRDWVEAAVDSVLRQTYPHIELIIADDASTDESREVIKRIHAQHPDIRIMLSDVNRGNCTAFNAAFRETKGAFVVDFAADDLMHPERIEKQVRKFEELDESYGVVFTDAEYIDENGVLLHRHYDTLREKGLLKHVPEGDVYRDVLSRYFIASPTMLIRRAVLDAIGGYDETLAYEDFDFWVRSARFFKYAFLNEPLTRIRRTGRSMSTGWYKKGDPQLHSTYLVCRKALSLCRDGEDRAALIRRARYELRQSVLSDNRTEANHFLELLEELDAVSSADRLFGIMRKSGLPLKWVRKVYHSIRFGGTL